VLFSTTAQPGWKDARWLGAYLVNSALLLGAAELLFIAAVMGEAPAAEMLRPAVGLLAVLNLVPLGLLANDFHPVLSRLYPRHTRLAAGLVLVLVGVVIPVGLLFVGGGVVIASVVLGAVVAANFGVRFVIIHLPHRVTET
jgi:hypothetical protein